MKISKFIISCHLVFLKHMILFEHTASNYSQLRIRRTDSSTESGMCDCYESIHRYNRENCFNVLKSGKGINFHA